MRELTYWHQSGVLFMLPDLTLLQRNILSLIAGTKNRGLNFHDYEIAHQFKVTEGAVVTALKILREKDYITTAKRKSPHRKLFASERTKTIIQKALDDAKLAKKQKATHTNGMGVENPTHTNGGGVTHTNGRGVLPIHLGECNRSKEVNQVNGDKSPGDNDKLFSGCDESGSSGEKKRRAFRKPTPAEVTSYAGGIGYDLDGGEFCDYYESKGWLIGKSAMKDWQAAVRTWQRNSKKSEPQDESYEPTPEELENLLRGAGKL